MQDAAHDYQKDKSHLPLSFEDGGKDGSDLISSLISPRAYGCIDTVKISRYSWHRRFTFVIFYYF